MAQITNDTKYGDIQIGDTFPKGVECGGEVVGVTSLPSSIDPQRNVVTLTILRRDVVTSIGNNGPFRRDVEHGTGAMWADETVGAAIKRSEFMSALVDHS